MQMGAPDDKRNCRWSLRVTASEDATVRAAADSTGMSLTGFVRSAATTEASRVPADRTSFELDAADWERLSELLDRPARVPAGLRDLFATTSAFA